MGLQSFTAKLYRLSRGTYAMSAQSGVRQVTTHHAALPCAQRHSRRDKTPATVSSVRGHGQPDGSRSTCRTLAFRP